jgi:3D (Asp-Asp-Asp) domain-containing protein
MKQICNKKGAALAVAILLAFTGAVCLLEGLALRWCGPVGRVAMAAFGGSEIEGFTITAYCPGKCCNGEWAGLTATGRSIDYYLARKVRIAAVDPAVIPMGTRFTYRGLEYCAVDIGGTIKGKRIDLLMPDHPAADRFGVKKGQSIVILDAGAPDAGTGEISRVNDNAPGKQIHSISGS